MYLRKKFIRRVRSVTSPYCTLKPPQTELFSYAYYLDNVEHLFELDHEEPVVFFHLVLEELFERVDRFS